MRNLSWYKGKKKILDGVSYKIGHNEKNFILKINKLSLEDAGDYVCNGFETVTGSRFSSTVHLDVTDSGKLSMVLICKLDTLCLNVVVLTSFDVLENCNGQFVEKASLPLQYFYGRHLRKIKEDTSGSL